MNGSSPSENSNSSLCLFFGRKIDSRRSWLLELCGSSVDVMVATGSGEVMTVAQVGVIVSRSLVEDAGSFKNSYILEFA